MVEGETPGVSLPADQIGLTGNTEADALLAQMQEKIDDTNKRLMLLVTSGQIWAKKTVDEAMMKSADELLAMNQQINEFMELNKEKIQVQTEATKIEAANQRDLIIFAFQTTINSLREMIQKNIVEAENLTLVQKIKINLELKKTVDFFTKELDKNILIAEATKEKIRAEFALLQQEQQIQANYATKEAFSTASKIKTTLSRALGVARAVLTFIGSSLPPVANAVISLSFTVAEQLLVIGKAYLSNPMTALYGVLSITASVFALAHAVQVQNEMASVKASLPTNLMSVDLNTVY